MQIVYVGSKPRNRNELLDYLRSFDIKNLSIDLRVEITKNIEGVMTSYLKEKPQLKPYYEGLINDARSACKEGGSMRRFTDSIVDLVIHLEQEEF